MLTLQQLKDMPARTIFATGNTLDNEEGVNITRSGKRIRWVAKRGGIHDWCIYVGLMDNTIDQVASHGNKIFDEHNIKKLVPCDDEAFGMYRV